MADIYIRQLVEWMNQHRNEENAKAMKKYMRDQFDFLGIEQCLALFVNDQANSHDALAQGNIFDFPLLFSESA